MNGMPILQLIKSQKILYEVIKHEYHPINNMRIILDCLACAMEDLSTHGPLKPEDTRGLFEQSLIDAAIEAMAPKKNHGQLFLKNY